MPRKARIALYPGTFDPITNGHMDIIRRATQVADHLIVAVARNAGKNPLLGVDERVELVCAEIAELNDPAAGRKVEARPFDNLLMHFAQSVGACLIVRGLRAVSDFEYEFQMAGMNARLDPDVDTVFLMASESHQFISSRFVKEIGRLGGDISSFVSPRVAQRLAARFAQERKNGDNAKTRVQTLEDSTGPRSPI
jgi:pantetheine-phosphate adenylyltransferase